MPAPTKAMMQDQLFPWVIHLIQTHLVSKLSKHQLNNLISLPPDKCVQIAQDIENAISLYNSTPTFPPVLLNTTHLKSIFDEPLPPYKHIIDKLHHDSTLLTTVFDELNNSSYFSEVYQITNPTYLLANLMILLYRNSLLTLHPELRIKKAQISSSLEEVMCKEYLAGRDSLLFQSTKHWLLDWEVEGFSEELAKLIKA